MNQHVVNKTKDIRKIKKQQNRINCEKRLTNIANDYISKLFLFRNVVCESPKIRRFIYYELKKMNVNFKTEIVGQGGSKRIGQYGIGWDLGRLTKWIHQGRLTSNMLESQCYSDYWFDFNRIREAFDKNRTKKEIYDIIKNEWSHSFDSGLLNPLDRCSIITTIVKIILVRKSNYSIKDCNIFFNFK